MILKRSPICHRRQQGCEYLVTVQPAVIHIAEHLWLEPPGGSGIIVPSGITLIENRALRKVGPHLRDLAVAVTVFRSGTVGHKAGSNIGDEDEFLELAPPVLPHLGIMAGVRQLVNRARVDGRIIVQALDSQGDVRHKEIEQGRVLPYQGLEQFIHRRALLEHNGAAAVKQVQYPYLQAGGRSCNLTGFRLALPYPVPAGIIHYAAGK